MYKVNLEAIATLSYMEDSNEFLAIYWGGDCDTVEALSLTNEGITSNTISLMTEHLEREERELIQSLLLGAKGNLISYLLMEGKTTTAKEDLEEMELSISKRVITLTDTEAEAELERELS